MKVGILTSSRADSSIYYPLFKKLFADEFFEPEIIAFGTHLSRSHGYTIDTIEADGFPVRHRVNTMPDGDKPGDITRAMGKTMINFSELWKENQFDLVFALGDRFEMFAAVASSVPFNIRVAHLHGGETTLGAIDDAFRHSITHMSHVHFASAAPYAVRVEELTGSNKHVYNVGALGFDNLKNLKLHSIGGFQEKFGIDLAKPTILITFHPETIAYEKNAAYVDELVNALNEITGFQYLITMPNADTMGNLVRTRLQELINLNPRAFGYENLGTVGYLTAMKYCVCMLGNTSSGCIEASYFPKWVINLGDRQLGRIVTPNMINCEIAKEKIVAAVNFATHTSEPAKPEVYGDGTTADKIINILKEIYA